MGFKNVCIIIMKLTGDAKDVGEIAPHPRRGSIETDEANIDADVGTLLPYAAQITRTHS